MKHTISRIIRFLVSGVSAAAVEYIVFLWLHFLIGNRSLVICQSVSFMCGFVVSFTLNQKWVFKSDGDSKKELTRYTLLAFINLLLSNVMIWLFVNKLSIVFWFSKLMVMVLIAAWNYIIYQKLVFTHRT